jgi:hypothetical protein
MRRWWDRVLASPRALAAVGIGVVVVVAVAATVAITSSGDDDPSSSAVTARSPRSPADAPTKNPGKGATTAPTVLPPNRDKYCPAFRQITKGGVSTPGGDEDDQVDLAELSRTFARLLTLYETAARVSPRSLRDDYAQAIGYLKQGEKATASKDVQLLKALVVNLDNLNDSMDAIQSKSATFCR